MGKYLILRKHVYDGQVLNTYNACTVQYTMGKYLILRKYVYDGQVLNLYSLESI